MTKIVPKMSMATSLSLTNPELKNHTTFKAATPPGPSLTKSESKDPVFAIHNNLSAPHNFLHLESTTNGSTAMSQFPMIPENKTMASFVATTSIAPLSPYSHQ
jgi:hypothetical protein